MSIGAVDMMLDNGEFVSLYEGCSTNILIGAVAHSKVVYLRATYGCMRFILSNFKDIPAPKNRVVEVDAFVWYGDIAATIFANLIDYEAFWEMLNG